MYSSKLFIHQKFNFKTKSKSAYFNKIDGYKIYSECILENFIDFKYIYDFPILTLGLTYNSKSL